MLNPQHSAVKDGNLSSLVRVSRGSTWTACRGRTRKVDVFRGRRHLGYALKLGGRTFHAVRFARGDFPERSVGFVWSLAGAVRLIGGGAK